MRVALVLALVACTTTKTAEQHAEVGLETHAEQKAEVHQDVKMDQHEGPWRITRYFYPKGGGPTEPSERQRLPAGERDPDGLAVAQGGDADAGAAPLVVEVEDHFGRDTTWQAKSDGTSGAEQQTSLKAASQAESSVTRSWWPPAWLLASLALGAAVALWALRRKIRALKGLL